MKRMLIPFAAFVFAFSLAATCCPSANPNALYVAFGDSVTDSDASIKYPWYIRQWLGLSDNQLVNEGQSGETIADGKGRLLEILDCDTYPGADIYLFEEGGNDLIDWIQEVDSTVTWSPMSPLYPWKAELAAKLNEIESNLTQACAAILDSGAEPIIMTYFEVLPFVSPCGLTPLNAFTPGQAEKINQYVALLNERIWNVSDTLGLAVADVGSTGALYDDPDNFLNCNHPNAVGNEIIAQHFYDQIAAIGPATPDANVSGRGAVPFLLR